MRTFAFLLVLTFAAITPLAAAPVPVPGVREAEQLVEKLGSEEYAEREAATKRLEELGPLALDALRAASKSNNPEVAERAKDLVRKVEFRIASDRLLAPTLVELDAKDTSVDDVLASLSKQSGCEVVVGGLKPQDAAAKKITVATGKVPFWNAVLKVCDAGQLQVAGAGGFLAPGALPYYPRVKEGEKLRVAADPDRAVILEPRDGVRQRPASVHGAVLVEAFEPPRNRVQVSAGLQVWPEPKIAWQSLSSTKLTRSVDGDGRKLTPDFTPAPLVRRPGGNPVVRNPDGSVAIGGPFQPNLRQAVVKFKPGEETPSSASELSGSVFGLVRGTPEPVATIKLDPKNAVTASGLAGVEMKSSAARTVANGRTFVDVTVSFVPPLVDAARPSDELPDVKPSATGGNRSVLGVRVTDANGAAFALSLVNQRSDFDGMNKRVVANLSLELILEKDGPTTPAKVTFWGTTIKPVEVPFVLKDVPLK